VSETETETPSDDPAAASDDLGSDDPGSDEAGATNERARESVEHLQAAARELIAAARAALDVAEDLVDDPDVAATMAGAVGSFGDVVRNLAASWRTGGSPVGNGHVDDDTSTFGYEGPEPPDSGVERIPIS
jgi:hypothetical protein